MKKLIAAGLLSIAILVGCTTKTIRVDWSMFPYQREVSISKTLDKKYLSLKTVIGDINVQGTTGTETTVSLTILEKEENDAGVSFDENGIKVESKKGLPTYFGNLVVTVPLTTSLLLQNDSGNIEICNFDCENITLTSDVGNIDITDANAVNIEAITDVGNIRITDTKTKYIKATTNMGNIFIKNLHYRKSRIYTKLGRMEVEE